jgi:DNA polymerase alpha subunit A
MYEEKDGKVTEVKETKGLDLVRRDWCELSQDVGNFVLDRILSGAQREEVVASIHEHLSKVAEDIRANRVPLRKYIINKCLTKPPESYPDKGGLPHVHVALALKARGDPVPVGTHIQYCICASDDKSMNYAKRAYAPDQIERAEGMLQVDAEWYLSQQIHPPISRLLNPIEGTDSGRIAECLGLDASKFRSQIAKEDEEDAIPNVVLDDVERFRDCKVFEMTCPACSTPIRPGDQEWANRLKCANCKEKIPVHSVENALTQAVRAAMTTFNDGWMACEESTCTQRIRQVSISYTNTGKRTEVGHQCLRVGCHGRMEKEYTDKALYTQLVYLQSIFDYQRYDRLAERKVQGTGKEDRLERVEDKVFMIQSELQQLSRHMQGYLQQSDFNVVSLADVFAGVVGK